MNILISGASGLIGSSLIPELASNGHTVRCLVRSSMPATDPSAVSWNPTTSWIDARSLAGYDAVIHLAGQGIANRRWTDRQKALIRDSRVQGTRLLCESLAGLDHQPKVVLCASAIGIYGHRAAELLDERSKPGKGFLAEVCQAWEHAVEPAANAGIRVVNLRIGIVLSRQGGALAKMLLPFRLGLGGRIGDGRQYLSWIAIDDVVGGDPTRLGYGLFARPSHRGCAHSRDQP